MLWASQLNKLKRYSNNAIARRRRRGNASFKVEINSNIQDTQYSSLNHFCYLIQMNLKHVSDKTLLKDLKMIVANERVFLTKILHHLLEIDERKLYSDLKYASLFEYAVRDLGYSEASASRRIQAARLLKQVPSIERRIESNLANAQRMFNENNVRDPEEKKIIIKKLENKTTRECEKELLSMLPTKPLPPETIKPITQEYNQLKINISETTLRLLTEAKNLMGQKYINDQFLSKLTNEALTNIKKNKFKITNSPRSSEQNPDSRYLTHQTKREVKENSNGVCEKCGSVFMLQFDHIQAFSLGGKTETKNLRLLCFNCNQRARIRARI